MFRPAIIIGAAVILASLGAVVQAKTGKPEAAEQNEMATAASAKVPLRDAIAAAEQHLQGKAVRADFESENGSPGEYKIEVVAGTKVFDVRVDADKGTVITAKEDNADGDDDEKEAD